MKLRLVPLFSALALCAALTHADVPTPYDPHAQGSVQLQQALTQAKTQQRKVLVIFGANWCKDCIELDRAMKTESKAFLDRHFVVVKIDVGQFDKHLDLAQAYGNPIKKGIPAAVLLSADHTLLYATQAGELSNARRMSAQGITEFFRHLDTLSP